METKKNFHEELDIHFRSIELEIDELAAADNAEMQPIIKHQIKVEKELHRLRRVGDAARVEVEHALYKLRTSLDKFMAKQQSGK